MLDALSIRLEHARVWDFDYGYGLRWISLVVALYFFFCSCHYISVFLSMVCMVAVFRPPKRERLHIKQLQIQSTGVERPRRNGGL